jgi:hypothetical protein
MFTRWIASVGWAHRTVYAPSAVSRLERLAVAGAALAFVAHLAIIAVAKQSRGSLDLDWFSSSYLAALYTPFSFLLFFEVLMLVRALPESFSRSVALQYEVVALIVLRRIFKDIAHLDGAELVELSNPVVWEVAADMVGCLFLFVLARRFAASVPRHTEPVEAALLRFVALKQAVSLLLGVLVIALAVVHLARWTVEMIDLAAGARHAVTDVDALFYKDFFGLLVLVDVLLLLLSFGLTHDATLIFRNAAFIASTVIVRLAFSAPQLDSVVMLVFAVSFGVAVQLGVASARASAPVTDHGRPG